jgi:hypothetical protein
MAFMELENLQVCLLESLSMMAALKTLPTYLN